MPKVSKRNKFKGTPSWKKRKLQAQSTEKNDERSLVNNTSEAHLTDGNSSDDRPQRKIITASERKLQSFFGHKVNDDSGADFRLNNSDTGYRFVNFSSIKQAFQECHNCDDAEVLVEDEDKRYGQSLVFSLECSKCHKKIFCKPQSQMEFYGNPMMPWILIENLFMLHLRLGLAGKDLQLYVTF